MNKKPPIRSNGFIKKDSKNKINRGVPAKKSQVPIAPIVPIATSAVITPGPGPVGEGTPYKSKIQTILHNRIAAGNKLISNIRAISILGNQDLNAHIQISGLYEQLPGYIFCGSKPTDDSPSLLPKTMYINLFKNEYAHPTGPKLLNIICPHEQMPKKINDYDIKLISDIELFYCEGDYYEIVSGQHYKLEDSNSESFEIIVVYSVQTVNHLSLSPVITADGKCTLKGCDIYRNFIDDMWEPTKRFMEAFYTTYTLICRTLEDVKKLKLDVSYIDVPSLSVELEKECDITRVKAPYQKMDLICNHSISFLALMGQVLHKQNDNLTCPVCRKNMKIKRINSKMTRSKNIVVDDVSTECSQYIWSLLGDKNGKFSNNNGLITYSDEENSKAPDAIEFIDHLIGDSSGSEEDVRERRTRDNSEDGNHNHNHNHHHHIRHHHEDDDSLQSIDSESVDDSWSERSSNERSEDEDLVLTAALQASLTNM